MTNIAVSHINNEPLIIAEGMDLLSLACQEVGLDLSSEVLSPPAAQFAVELHIREEERPDRLERMVPRQLSYQPDQEGEGEVKDVLREVLREVG